MERQLDLQQKQINKLESAVEDWNKAQKAFADQGEKIQGASTGPMGVLQNAWRNTISKGSLNTAGKMRTCFPEDYIWRTDTRTTPWTLLLKRLDKTATPGFYIRA